MLSLCFPRFLYVLSMFFLFAFSMFLCVFHVFFSTFSLLKSMLSLCVLYVSSMLSLRFLYVFSMLRFAFPCDLTGEPHRVTSSWKIIDRRSFGQVTSPLLKLFIVCTICTICTVSEQQAMNPSKAFWSFWAFVPWWHFKMISDDPKSDVPGGSGWQWVSGGIEVKPVFLTVISCHLYFVAKQLWVAETYTVMLTIVN